MQLNRRSFAVAGAVASAAFAVGESRAAETDDSAIAQAADRYRAALLSGDKAQLDALCADQMTYGHSSGRVQTKAEFVAEASSGKAKWKFINLTDLTNRLAGSNGLSRCVFVGENESGGKTNAVKFGLLMVWQKQGNDWKLLARQGYKI